MRNNRTPLAAVLLAGLFAFASPASAQVIKLGTIAPKGSPWYDSLVELSQSWSKISNGKIKMRIYPDGIAGDEPVMIQQMRVGRLHAAALTSISLVSIEKDIEALTFPTMLRSDEELDHLIKQLGPEFEDRLEAKGFKVLNWTSTGWVRFYTKEPAVTLEALQKHKMIFWGQDPEYAAFLKSVGIQTVPLTVTDMLPALQTGTADAFAAPPVAALAFQWYGQAKNMTDFKWQPIPGMVVMSKRGWRMIKDEWKPELIKSSQEIAAELMKTSRSLEEDAIKAMTKNGLKVHTLTPETDAEFRRIMMEKGVPVFVGDRISTEMFQRVQKELESFRAKRDAN